MSGDIPGWTRFVLTGPACLCSSVVMIDVPDTQAPSRRRALPVSYRQTDNSQEHLNARQPVVEYFHSSPTYTQVCARLHVGAFRAQSTTTPTCAAVDRICIDRGDGREDAACGLMPFGGAWSTFTRFAGACAEGAAS